MWLRAHCFCSFNSPCLLRSHIKQQQQPDFLHRVSCSLSLSFILHGMVSSFADSGVCLQGPQLTARLELMAHAQKRYSHCRSRITHNGGKQTDASVSAIQNQRIFKGNVGGASPPVVSIPIASVLCLLNCVHMWVCRGAAGCSSLCSPYHHDGWDKRTKGLLPSCGPYQRCESHEASDLKVGLIFLMLGYQRSRPCLCPTPWDPKYEQV